MEKRLLLAVALSFLVVFVSNVLMTKDVKKAPNKRPPAAVEQVADDVADAPVASESVTAKSTAAVVVPAAENLRDITVDTKLFTATFTNFGARLKSLKLKDYKVEQTQNSALIDLVTVTDLTKLPLDIHLFSTQKEKNLTGDELYNVDVDSLDILNDPANNKLVFSYLTKSGLEVRKIYAFSNDRYNIDLEVLIINKSADRFIGKMNLNWIERFSKNKKDRAAVLETFAFSNKEVSRVTSKNLIKKEQVLTGDIKWTGFSNKFFIFAFVNQEGATADTSFYADNLADDLFLFRTTTGKLSIGSDETRAVKYNIYLGPKLSENLKEYKVGLQSAINYGFFSIISIPLMETLKFFYRFTHNYGIAIIILTLIIKLLFFPLTQKSYKAMKDMQKVAPMINQIKEKYKDDKERLNKEVLELYKRHRVNPLGGCLPMVLQIPVFFALYRVLLGSVELRHAPFYFWITDLSSKDPYYITPVIMGVTMFIQQKMSPSTGDGVQKKMMMLMPVVFTFMFANFPAGLVIYWLVNNIASIVQQGYVNKNT